MIPHLIFNAILLARLISCVQIVAAKPYSLALAKANASSSVLKDCNVTTGPKISSILVLQFGPKFSIIVGATKKPFLFSPSNCTALPPNKILPPSSLAIAIQFNIFSKCILLTTAPCLLVSSNGLPTVSFFTRSINSSLNFS